MESLTPDALENKRGVFFRDTLLQPEILSMYQVGMIFREPTFCDATYKFGGFAAPHRYLIISENAKCLDSYSEHPEWGLCIWQRDSIFKVIAIQSTDFHSQITLLEIPKSNIIDYQTKTLSDGELNLAEQSVISFERAEQTPPRLEHITDDWLDRLTCPIGIKSPGQFFELWQPTITMETISGSPIQVVDWSVFNQQELLTNYALLLEELRSRGIVHSSNNPIGDYAETLVSRSLDLELVGGSTAGYDAIDKKSKIRYQIKGRRVTVQNSSTQLSAIRNIDDDPFDILAAVLFNADFSIRYAALIPIEVVKELARFSTHTNSSIFMFKPSVLMDDRVQNISSRLKY